MSTSAPRRRDSVRIVHPLLRLAVLLLALVQVVAPMWHVCEMSGSSCCECVQAIATNAQSGQQLPCSRCKGPQSATRTPHPSVTSNNNCPFQGTCLARLLESMPGHYYTFPPLPLHIVTRQLAALAPATLHSCATLPQPPARGPPAVISC